MFNTLFNNINIILLSKYIYIYIYMNIYMNKYLKYKKKYIKIKNTMKAGGFGTNSDIKDNKLPIITRQKSFDESNKLENSILIDNKFKDIIKNQINNYTNSLKNIELELKKKPNKENDKDPEKITTNDILNILEYNKLYKKTQSDYKILKEQIEEYKKKNSKLNEAQKDTEVFKNEEKDKKNKENEIQFLKKILNKFKNNIPLVKVMQVIGSWPSNNYYKDKKWNNAFMGEHWYFLEREFKSRFNVKPNTLRLNKYLGLPPYHNILFEVKDKTHCKLVDTTYIHKCYVFADYLLTCRKYNNIKTIKEIYNPFDKDINNNLKHNFKWNNDKFKWNNDKFKNFIKEKTKDLNFKCFCTFLIKKFEFNKKIDNLFENYEKKKNITEFIKELNETLKSNIILDFIYHTIPWSGKGRTFDYGSNKLGQLNQEGISEFMIPKGKYLNDEKFTPIFLEERIVPRTQ